MLKIILKKIKNKKWLTLCLFLGIAFLIATVSCFPMFKNGAIDVMIRNEYENLKDETNRNPFVINVKKQYTTDDAADFDSIMQIADKYSENWKKNFRDLNTITTQRFVYFSSLASKTSITKLGATLDVVCMDDMLSHAQMLAGVDYDDESLKDEYCCLVSTATYDYYRLSIGEKITVFSAEKAQGEYLQLKVCGVFDAADNKDPYWFTGPNDTTLRVYISKNSFDKMVNEYDLKAFTFEQFQTFDYNQVNSRNIINTIQGIRGVKANDGETSYNFQKVIKNYVSGEKTINISIWVLQIPILGMVLTFIFMVSGQILEAEKNEMAMMSSRGVRRRQIILIYTIQSGFIAIASLIAGLPLGYLACKLAAGAKDFLSFSFDNVGMYNFCLDMVLYAFVATLVGLVVVVLPVFKYSKTSIVQHKAGLVSRKKIFIYRYFLDIVILGLSIYLYTNYNKSVENIRVNALNGSKMDPMIFMDIVLFIIAAGLVMLRLSNYLVRLIYWFGRKKWKPAKYVSFLQITRSFNKQYFISVFMILTIAIGIFYGNASRTINGNYKDRIGYNTGADIVFGEKWKADFYKEGDKVNYEYIEPDYNVYNELCKNGVCKNMTRVISTDSLIINAGGKKTDDAQLMGINTKEFGQVANFDNDWNINQHWYNYLNLLADDSDGVIISRSVANAFGVKEGDRIEISRLGELADQKTEVRGLYNAKICAIVDNWPGYNRYYYSEGQLKERYLVVMNYAKAIDVFKVSPYKIWMQLNDGHNYNEVYNYINDNEKEIKSLTSIGEEIDELRFNYILQITNGMFTLSFIIAIVLCLIGFLIYWITSISQRQLLFGIYRAMGISVSEINGMLINEHIFSTFLSVVSGIGVGMVTSFVFTKLFSVIYLPEKHNLGTKVIYNVLDYVKLGTIIVIMIIICIMCLRSIIKRMDISKSLKLGED